MTSNYIPEIFRYFSSRTAPVIGSSSTRGIYDNVFKWLYSISESNQISANTFQLSIELFKIFMQSNSFSPPNLRLLGITCLFISSKYHGEGNWTLQQVRSFSGENFSAVHIQITEIYVLQTLNWKVALPTASEVLRVLLMATGITINFNRLFERSDAFVLSCYLDSKLIKFSTNEIAVVSVVCALEQFNQTDFRNQWVNYVFPRLRLDALALDRCKDMLVEKLISLTPVNDLNKIECLSRDKISSLIVPQGN
jgi:hypothetical protein